MPLPLFRYAGHAAGSECAIGGLNVRRAVAPKMEQHKFSQELYKGYGKSTMVILPMTFSSDDMS